MSSPEENVSSSEKLSALEAVCGSTSFSRSEQLRSFLRYVCEAEQAGQVGDLTEYLIGTKALGRMADFDPIHDSSVRTRAYELRQRLDRYYATEGSANPVRIQLPKDRKSTRLNSSH